jgi:hypothetical protein
LQWGGQKSGLVETATVGIELQFHIDRMTKGLLWLPLLALFFWLAWAGWNEYQKLEAYRTWAESFDRAKYDIYAVLGQKGNDLTWGKPTRKGPIALQTFSLRQVKSLQLLADDQAIELTTEMLPRVRRAALAFQLESGDRVTIPFTDLSLAQQWAKVLKQDQQQLQSEPNEAL